MLAGWHAGQQTLAGTFEMSRTGTLERHRRRDLYTARLPVMLEQLRADGFQVVSRRNPTNSAVITPEKTGFVISGFEADDRSGTLVRLSYFSTRSAARFWTHGSGSAA